MKYIAVLLCLLSSTSIFAEQYTVGVVPQFASQGLNTIWQPLLTEISSRTGVTLKLVSEESIPAFEESFMRGDYDFAYMNPWHSVIAYEKQGYIPIIKDASRKLRGILVVNKDSSITAVSELQDSEIAFPAPNALGASLLMRADLKQLFNLNIKPVYVKTHPSVYLNVALKTTIAGGGVLGTLRKQPQALQDKLKIIYQTREVNPHPIVAHPRVDKLLQEKVQAAILAISADPKTQHLLADIPIQQASPAALAEYLQLKEWGLDAFYVEN